MFGSGSEHCAFYRATALSAICKGDRSLSRGGNDRFLTTITRTVCGGLEAFADLGGGGKVHNSTGEV